MSTKEITLKTEGGLPAITFADVKEYICPVANDQEIGLFLNICRAENLNPFKKEIYLVKYTQTDSASIVVAIDAFIKAAENNAEYDGIEYGVILNRKETGLEYRAGEFLLPDESPLLVGGWAKVYRKDRKIPAYSAVGIKEYQKYKKDGTLTKFWNLMPATMVAKVARAHALKLSFPNRYSSIKLEDYIDFEIKKPVVETPELLQARQAVIADWTGTEKPPERSKATEDTTITALEAIAGKTQGKDAESLPSLWGKDKVGETNPLTQKITPADIRQVYAGIGGIEMHATDFMPLVFKKFNLSKIEDMTVAQKDLVFTWFKQLFDRGLQGDEALAYLKKL